MSGIPAPPAAPTAEQLKEKKVPLSGGGGGAPKLFDGGEKAAHGRVGKRNGWELPYMAVECDASVRPDQHNDTKAHEFLDSPEVLSEKVDLLIELLRAAGDQSIVYSGAGISRAAGVPDYATKAANSLSGASAPKLESPLDALPSLTHRILTQLHFAHGFVGQWINQNHDGLAEKAGFPSTLANSIHGDWFDPSNPVVQFSGNLRTDLFERLLEWEKKATLTICVGTSLSGMNADRVVESVARRCDIKHGDVAGASQFGAVIVNLQKTRLDANCTLRIWAKIDDVFQLVAEKLKLDPALYAMPPQPFPALPAGTVFRLPRYDATGARLPADARDSNTQLDLTFGAAVRIANPHASNRDAVGEISGQDRGGHFTVAFKQKGKLTRVYVLGRWWVLAAINGQLEQLPIVNP